jgi:hypothetical protein
MSVNAATRLIVVKTPADFVGSALGESRRTPRAFLPPRRVGNAGPIEHFMASGR